MMDTTRLHPMDKAPRPYVSIVLRKPDGLEYYGLTYCSRRGEFIEPISGSEATNVIGPVDGWRYDERPAA
jgi:hypothetical protein